MKSDILTSALRLSEVNRWGIIGVTRPQSVAEHTFRVLLIATDLLETAEDGLVHNSFDRELLANAVLMHDMLELVTGDLPSPFKRALEKAAPGAYAAAALACARDNPFIDVAPDLLEQAQYAQAAIRGTWLVNILKLADVLEAVLYLREWGRSTDERTQFVLGDLERTVISLTNVLPPVGTPGDGGITWTRVVVRALAILGDRQGYNYVHQSGVPAQTT